MNTKIDHRRQEVQQTVKNACDELNVAGVDARNYVEQLAWLFFLKAFDEAEGRREDEAAFDDGSFERLLTGEFAWSSWSKRNPDDMLEFVNGKLWTKLTSPDPKKGLGNEPIAQRFRRVFENVRNHCRNGVTFARVVGQVNKLHFASDTDVHVLSEIYEDLLKRVAADSAGYAGEFYTQRHIIRAMVEVVKPKVGDRVYDPCFGTAGFLGEAADYIRAHGNLSRKHLDTLQKNTFYGLEVKPLTYLLGTMNMILHGIEGANLELANTLEVHSSNVNEKDKYSVILANPPYGGKMAQALQNNFRVKSGATECLFVQHIMANLAKGGRAAVVVPEGVLFRGGPDQKVRQELLQRFNVHTLLSLPAGCFLPYTGVKTNVIFFDRPHVDPKSDEWATSSVWFYELTNDGFELKSTRKPRNGNQLPDFLKIQPKAKVGDSSWSVPMEVLAEHGYDLSVKNPNRLEVHEQRSAKELVQSIKAKEERIIELLSELENIVSGFRCPIKHRKTEKLGDLASRIGGGTPSRKEPSFWGGTIPWFTVADLADIDDIQELSVSRECITEVGLEKSSSKLIPAGAVVFSNRVVVGKIGITERPIATNQDFTSFVPPNRVLPRFLAYFLLKVKNDLRSHQRGATIKGVTTKIIDDLDVPMVSELVQTTVIDFLAECMERLEEIEDLQNFPTVEISGLRKSILRKAFAGEIQ